MSHDNITVVDPGVVRDRLSDVLESGWHPATLHSNDPGRGFAFLCHTRHIPRDRPGHDPRGIHEVSAQALQEWADDDYSQSPYQYATRNKVCHKTSGHSRRLTVHESE
eukprot:5422265-Karenia_brevis.AAC.1